MQKEKLTELKKMFKKGTRVELLKPFGENYNIPAGSLGTISGVNCFGVILIKWDNNKEQFGISFENINIIRKAVPVLLKTMYSWGEEESDERYDTLTEAWNAAKQKAIDEAEITSIKHNCSVPICFSETEHTICLKYTYDNTYCKYVVTEE